MKIDTNINEFLKEQRLSQHLSIHNLSSLSGVSASHISRIERTKRNPSSKILKKLSSPLNVDYATLLQVANLLSVGSSDYIDLKSIIINNKCIVDGAELTKSQIDSFLKFIDNM